MRFLLEQESDTAGVLSLTTTAIRPERPVDRGVVVGVLDVVAHGHVVTELVVAGADVRRQRQAEADGHLELDRRVRVLLGEVEFHQVGLEVVADHGRPLLTGQPAEDVPDGDDPDLDVVDTAGGLVVEDADVDVALLEAVERGAERLRDALAQVSVHLGEVF